MANTYTQVHHHFVFAPRYRAALIAPEWEERLYAYMTGIVQAYDHKLLATGGMPDHIHMLIGLRPKQSASDLMDKLKAGASGWINEQRFLPGRFEWQRGFGEFAYHKSQVPVVMAYIRNQKEHHRRVSFLEEYRALLQEHEVEFDERYIFHAPE